MVKPFKENDTMKWLKNMKEINVIHAPEGVIKTSGSNSLKLVNQVIITALQDDLNLKVCLSLTVHLSK